MATHEQSRKARRALDARLGELGTPDRFTAPAAGWVRAIRDALAMPASELGRRLGISQPAVFALERSEQQGSARLNSLRKAARAMDCEFVYAFIPKHGLERTVRTRAEELADAELRSTQQTMALEDQASPVTQDLREDLIQKLIVSRGLWRQR